ncbi:MAG: hypothetical protein VW268_00065 [Rhodospirillaceae bacterium]
MRQSRLQLVFGVVKVALFTLAVLLQMLPFFFVLLVIAFNLGIKGPGMLITFPMFLIASFGAACWLTARHLRRHAPWARAPDLHDRPKGTEPKPRRQGKDVTGLFKTREERYQQMIDYLAPNRR